MRKKLSQTKINNGLDSVVVQILFFETDDTQRLEKLNKFGSCLDILAKQGYDVTEYRGIYEELKGDEEKYGWIHNNGKRHR